MILREMLVDDLDQVMEIEQDLFHVPWTKEGFFTFLTRDDAMFLVVEEKEKILGYCGLLMVLDEGDITNVAVRRDRQKEGIGAFLNAEPDPSCSREGGYDNPSGSTCGK